MRVRAISGASAHELGENVRVRVVFGASAHEMGENVRERVVLGASAHEMGENVRVRAISGASAHEFDENVREGERLGDERMKWRGGGRRARRGVLADEPFVAGEEGEELGGDGAAEKGQQGDERDGKIDGDSRGGCVAADDEVGDGHKV